MKYTFLIRCLLGLETILGGLTVQLCGLRLYTTREHGCSERQHCKKSLTYVRLFEFQCCDLHTNNPMLDLVLQLCNNPIQH